MVIEGIITQTRFKILKSSFMIRLPYDRSLDHCAYSLNLKINIEFKESVQIKDRNPSCVTGLGAERSVATFLVDGFAPWLVYHFNQQNWINSTSNHLLEVFKYFHELHNMRYLFLLWTFSHFDVSRGCNAHCSLYYRLR